MFAPAHLECGSPARTPKKSVPENRDAQNFFQIVFRLRFYRRGQQRRYWRVIRTAAGPAYFSDLEAHKTADRNVLTKLGDGLSNHFTDGHAFVLDVVLFVEAVFLVELFHFSVDDFVDNVFRFAGGQRLRLVNIALFFEHVRRHFFAPHVAWIQSRSEEHTSELQSRQYLVCRLLL